MKKVAVTLLLLLTIAGSMAAGTLSSYTATIDNLSSGSVSAKEFVFVGDGSGSFQQGVKIAPSETVRWQFDVKNYQGSVVTETDLYYKLTFTVKAAEGKHAIDPLTVTVKDTDGNVLGSATGTGTFSILGAFPLSAAGQAKTYIVELNWPSGTNDAQYAGGSFGTSVRVDAVASQIPLSGDPDTPPQNQSIHVLYETTAPWQNGQSGPHYYQYQITITNNSDETINDWYILFSLPTDRLSASLWRAKNLSGGLPDGSYKIGNPGYNNSSTDNILPGQSVTFSGQAVGMGTEPIQNIQVGGSNTGTPSGVTLDCQFGKTSLN